MNTVATEGQATAAIRAKPGTSPFPSEGKTRAKPSALFLGIGLSTFWLYVKQGRINQPMRYGVRVSVWDAEYIRSLAANGIPEALTGCEGVK